MFGTANAIEPVEIARTKPAVRAKEEEPPIREATRADTIAAAKRRDAEAKAVAADPVRAVSPSKPGWFGRRQAEPAQPDAVSQRHGLYVAEKRGTRTYFADYQQKQEVMRADAKRISTKQDDRQTVSVMLDLAQERGWSRVRVRGTEDFKRETWVQAQVRGIAAEGYKPSATDEQEVARRKAGLLPADKQGQQAASGRAKTGEIPGHVKPGNHEMGPEEAALRQKMETPVHPAAVPPQAKPVPVVAASAPQPAARVTSDELAAAKGAPAPQGLPDAEVKRINSDAMTQARVWKVINDPKADPAGVREALNAAPEADRQRLAAEVMQGLERRAAKTGSREEYDRIAPYVPGSLAEFDAKRAAMTPEQRDAVSRAALGSLHPSRSSEKTAEGAPMADAQARAKAVWGSIEDAGRVLREKAAASAVVEKGAERAGERKIAVQRAG